MRKQFPFFTLIVITAFLILFGCSRSADQTEPIESFSLSRIEPMRIDAENPERYLIAPEGEQEKIVLSIPELGKNLGRNEILTYELECVSVTDEEITLQFNNDEHYFDRLSKSVAQNKAGILYQYQVETSSNG